MELFPENHRSADQLPAELEANKHLKKIYSLIKRDSHHFQEKDYQEWINDVEQTTLSREERERSQAQQLIEQAYQILESKSTWSVEDERLYEALEKIIFIKGRQGKTKDYFDSIEQVVVGVMNNDLNMEAPVVETSGDQRNILNYFSTTLNYIIEYIKNELVTQASFDAVLDLLKGEHTYVFVTNIEGDIRYVNNPDLKSCYQTIEEVFVNFSAIEHELDTRNELTNFRTTLVHDKREGFLTQVEVPILPESDQEPEFIYLFQEKERTVDRENIEKISHDLIAPMTSMQGLLQLINNSRNEVANYLNLLETSAEKVLKETTGQLDHHVDVPVVLEPKVEVEAVIDQLKFMPDANSIEFKVHDEGSGVFSCYRSVFRSILQNIISNAIKYRNVDTTQPEVIISINKSNSKVTVAVEDNGMGIAQELQGRIFEKGTGLKHGNSHGFGLYYVKHQLNKLGGTVDVQSTLGSGTRFKVMLPSLA